MRLSPDYLLRIHLCLLVYPVIRLLECFWASCSVYSLLPFRAFFSSAISLISSALGIRWLSGGYVMYDRCGQGEQCNETVH